MSETTLLMGDFEILSNEEETEWVLHDRLNPSHPYTFDTLDDLLDEIRQIIERGEA